VIRKATLFCLFCSFHTALTTPSFGQFTDASDELGFGGGGKAAFGDYNHDGFVDLYTGKLWRNEHGKRFIEVTDSGIEGGEGIWGDYDNDGNLDLFTFTGSGALYNNRGDGTFDAIAFPELPTKNSRGAVWIDINNDSLLDLYVGGYEIWQQAVHPDVVYMNKGQGNFEEVWRSPENYSARGITAADYDEDGFVDVYVSNYRLQPNFLWKNDHKNGFENIAEQSKAHGIPDAVISYTGGIKYPICGHTIGSCFSDMNNDGLIDLFVGNFSHPRAGQDHPQFLQNGGAENNFVFEDKSESAGLAWQESYASPTFGDFNNDGLQDFFFTTVYGVGSGNIRNYPVLYQGKGNWAFEDVTSLQQLNELPPTYQAALADIDNDGDLDLCTAGKLFRNDNPLSGKWLKLQLAGDGTKVNTAGIGATVRIKVGDRIITRHIESGTGEGNQNDLTLHFGFGELDADTVSAEVTWPGNYKQTKNGLKLNTTHRIEMN
jgi:hypothetical protein